MNKIRQSYVFAGLAVLFWSTIPTAFKVSLQQIDILPLLTIASITSSAVLFIVVVSGHKAGLIAGATLKELLTSAVLGFINPFIYYLILLKAYRLLPAQVAQPLNMIWPLVLAFLSVPLLGQKIPAKSYAALFISFAGVYIIASRGHPFDTGRINLPGVLLATGSSVFWSFYFIINVRDKRDESVKLLMNFLFGSCYLIIALALTGGFHPGSFPLKGIAGSIYIGIFEMGITFLLWLKALQTAPSAARISNLVYLAPFFSLIPVHYILGEPVYYTTPAGLVLIIAGIWIQSRNS